MRRVTDAARTRSTATLRPLWRARLGALFASLVVLSFLGAAPALAQNGLELTKVFSPDTIASGGVSTAVFTISNTNGFPVTGLAFTDTLPTDVTIADPASASTTCTSATLSAPASGGTITFSGGSVGAGTSCTVHVNVTSSTTGTHTNPAVTLSSSVGTASSLAVGLTVSGADRPTFAKVFSDTSVPLGSPTTLTFTIDNGANGSIASSLAFTDNLPSGLEIATPNGLTNTCSGTLSAPAGGSTISLISGFILPNASCTISMQVTTVAVGTQVNVTSDLTSSPGFGTNNSGKATAALDVTNSTTAPNLTKSFTDDPVVPGGQVTLQFTILNPDRNFPATGITFTDDLNATVTGLAATGLPAAACGGTLSGSAGDTLLTLERRQFGGGSLLQLQRNPGCADRRGQWAAPQHDDRHRSNDRRQSRHRQSGV